MSSQETIGDWKSKLQAQIAGLVLSYQGDRTWADAYADASKWWKIATKFQGEAQKLNNIDADQKTDIVDIALDLGELKYAAKSQPQTAVLTESQKGEVVGKLTAPLRWLSAVGEPILQRQALIQDTVPDLVNLPGRGVAWVLEQFLRGLGLPSWALPVMGLVTIGGLGLWTYNTFLAPTGQAITIARLAAHTRGGRKKRRARLA